jgi:hypothetical protein
MEEMFSRGWHELLARDSGPLHVRLLFQPLIATILAIRVGWRDGREGRPVFFWSVVGDPARRRLLLREAWQHVGRLFIVAVVLDVVYQLIVLRWVYPVQTLVVATTLAVLPYLLIRGLTNRVVNGARLGPRPKCIEDPGDGSRDGSETDGAP